MAVIDLVNFQGRLPFVHPLKLDDEHGQTATNCRFDGGRLRAVSGPAPFKACYSGPAVKTLFRYTSSFFFEWTGRVHAVRSPVLRDAYDRVYWTGEAEPRVTHNAIATSGSGPYPSAWYRIGVPAPTTAPTVAVSGTATDPSDPLTTRFYTITFRNSYGEEGPNSPISAEVELRPGQSVDLSNLPGAPTGNYDITHVVIYRAEDAGDDAPYLYVGEVAIGTTAFSDTVVNAGPDELISQEFDEPPDDIEGLIEHPNGFLVAFRKNQLLFSEPGYPYAWPVRYRKVVGAAIMGLGIVGGELVVITDDRPFVAAGGHPASISVDEVRGLSQACVAKAGVVALGTGVAYPSPDGLVLLTGAGSGVATQTVFTRKQWGALKPSSFEAYPWEGVYVAFYNDGSSTGQQCLVVDPNTPQAGAVDLGVTATAGFLDREADTLYLVRDANDSAAPGWKADTAYSVGDFVLPTTANGFVYECTTAGTSGSIEPTWPTTAGGTVTDGTAVWTARTQLIEAWGEGSALTYTWRSRPYQLDRTGNFGVARVDADTYPLTFRLYTDGVKRLDKTVKDSTPFRLPGGYRARTLEIELSGTVDTARVTLADVMRNLP